MEFLIDQVFWNLVYIIWFLPSSYLFEGVGWRDLLGMERFPIKEWCWVLAAAPFNILFYAPIAARLD